MSALSRIRVVVAGGGLAGLSAARELQRQGLLVHLVEARDRLGGRVHTVRDADGLHVEAGGEFIDHPHDAIRSLAADLRLPLRRVLRAGFGLALHDGHRTRIFPTPTQPWRALERRLRPIADAYRAAGATWDTAAAAAIARRPASALVQSSSTPRYLRAFLESLRATTWPSPRSCQG